MVGRGNRFSVSPGDPGHLTQKAHFKTPLSDGWGLEFEGTSLLATDSGPLVHFLDPSTLELRRYIPLSHRQWATRSLPRSFDSGASEVRARGRRGAHSGDGERIGVDRWGTMGEYLRHGMHRSH